MILLASLLPQAVVAGTMLMLLLIGAVRRTPFLPAVRALAVLGFLLAWTFVPQAKSGAWVVWDGAARLWSLLFLFGGAALSLLVPAEDEVPFALIAGSVTGMLLLACSRHLLGLFLGLELMSLPAYLLVYSLRRTTASLEAAVKYFFAGGTAAALFLLGVALAYGETATLALAAPAGMALGLLGAAALFKIGAFPLHFWLPDVYEAARPELAGFFSTAMKAAAFLLLMRVLAAAPAGEEFLSALPAVAALTMTAGNLLALRQTSVQRLLAYSSISHAGYVLLGVAAWAKDGARWDGAAPVFVYLAAYSAMSFGAFTALRETGARDTEDLKGLGRRSPVAAGLLTLMLLSLAGLPPTAGFVAKLLVFWDAVRAGLTGWVALAALNSLVGLAYYFTLVRAMWLEDGEAPAREPSFAGAAVAWACALPTLALGVWPDVAAKVGEALWRS